jgi:parallel beta-helix repeat protein
LFSKGFNSFHGNTVEGKGKEMKRAVSGTLLTLLLAGILTLVLNVQPVKANGTIYIRADGSIDLPTANITTSDYVTYTFIGNITDLIIVERSNIIIDGNGYMLQGSGSGNGFYWSGINNVAIRNTNIKNFQYGIYLLESSNSSISGNNITANNGDGIRLDSSSSNSISGNNIANNSVGIRLDSSSSNSISGNNITANYAYGIALGSSSNSSISGNNITNNSNYGIWLSSSSNNSIYGNNIANNMMGIWLGSSSNSSISGNNITANNGDGIWLSSSSNNSISGNNVTANNGYGVVLGSSSNYNSISENNIANNSVGIGLFSSSNYNSISENNITNNHHGIWLFSSSNSSISENNITNNYYGIWHEASSDNSIYHNHLVNNTLQVVIAYPGYTSVWDDGYPSGGNYWSDYSGVDSNGDGIGDTPYIFDSSQDRYPLMNPGNLDTTSPYITILSPQNKTYITSSIPLTFTVNEPTSWIGYSLDGQANVTISGNTTLTSLSYGQHSITVYANDTSGNMGASNKVFLTVQTPPPNPIAPIRETPPPENVAVAVAAGAAITVGFTGLMSLSGLGQSLNSAITKMNIPDWLKDFLKSYSEEVFKTLTKEKMKAKKKVFTKKEIATIIFSASIITIVFGYVEANGLPQFSSLSVLAVVIPPVLSTVVLISVTDALFTALSSKTCNVKSESKVWLHGVIAFLVSGLLFLVPFASPTRSTYQCGEISKKTKGLLVLSKMLLFLTLSIPFSLLFIFGFMSLGDNGLLIILITVSYSLIPIKPLEGKEIFDFDKKVWLATFIPVLFLFLGWVLHLLPHIVYLGVGLSSAFIWAVTFRQATSKKRNE